MFKKEKPNETAYSRARSKEIPPPVSLEKLLLHHQVAKINRAVTVRRE
jgi:hypothetical protein